MSEALSLIRSLQAVSPIAAYYAFIGAYCWYCGRDLSAERPVIEHRTPLSRGGEDSPENTCVACYGCNSMKSDRTVEEYRSLMSERTGIQRYQFFGETDMYLDLEKNYAQQITNP